MVLYDSFDATVLKLKLGLGRESLPGSVSIRTKYDITYLVQSLFEPNMKIFTWLSFYSNQVRYCLLGSVSIRIGSAKIFIRFDLQSDQVRVLG